MSQFVLRCTVSRWPDLRAVLWIHGAWSASGLCGICPRAIRPGVEFQSMDPRAAVHGVPGLVRPVPSPHGPRLAALAVAVESRRCPYHLRSRCGFLRVGRPENLVTALTRPPNPY